MKVNSLLLVAAIAATTSLPISANSDLTLEQRIERLEQQAKTRQQLQAEMSQQLIELQKEVRELRGIAEEHEYKLQQIQERQRDLYRDIENRLSALPKAGTQANTSQSGSAQSSQQSSSSASTATRNQSSSGAQTDSGNNGRVEFENAFKLVRNKQYDAAIQSFEAFLQNYPNGAYSDNARFWIGQVYFAQSNFEKAEEQFNLMRTEFPDSSKMSAAMLKLADIKVKQEKWEEAKTLYNEIVSKYTGAPQQLARKGLQDIKQKGH